MSHSFELYRFGESIVDVDNIELATYEYEWNTWKKGVIKLKANTISTTLFNLLQFGSELRIFRKGNNDTSTKLVFAGEIRNVKKQKNSVGVITLDFDIYPVDEILEGREYTGSFVDTEESAIFQSVLNSVQSDTESGNFTVSQSSLDIVEGNIEVTGNLRTRDYEQDSALDIIRDLGSRKDTLGNTTRLRGYRIYPDIMTPSYRRVDYLANYGVYRKNVVYTAKSISNFQLLENFDYANHIIAYGKDGIRVESYSSNTSNKNNYRKRTKRLTDTNITTTDDLQDFADEKLIKHEQLPTFFTFDIVENDPLTGKYRVGDKIKVVYKNNYFDINTILTVFGIKVTYSKKKEKITLKVAEERPADLDITKVARLNTRLKETKQQITGIAK